MKAHNNKYSWNLCSVRVRMNILFLFCFNAGITKYSEERCTQRNIFEILLIQPEIRLYLPFSDWFGTKRTFVWFQTIQKMVNTIWVLADLIRFRKYFSVCSGCEFCSPAPERYVGYYASRALMQLMRNLILIMHFNFNSDITQRYLYRIHFKLKGIGNWFLWV